MNANVIVDLPSLSIHSQDVNIQTALDINSVHARNLELAVYYIQGFLGATQEAIKGTSMRD